jgi:hypothetical protein
MLMAPEDSRAQLTSALRRFQRRLRLREFVRVLPIAMAVALAAAAAAVWFGTAALFALAISLVFAAAAAAGVAAVRTPSLERSAQIVDCELGLQDRTVSALQFSGMDDAISQLVVGDGASRLQRQPVTALAVSVPAFGRWAAIAAAALFAIVAVVHENSQPAQSGAHSGPGIAGQAGLTQSRPPASPGRSAAQDAANQAEAPPDSATASAPRQTSRLGGPPRAGERSGANAADTLKPETDETVAATPPVSRAAGAGAPGAAQTEGAGASGPARARSQTSASSPPQGAGRGAGAAEGHQNSAGGVAGGELGENKAPTAAVVPPPVDRHSAAYATAYTRAEAATSAERIPAPLRAYVRAYFLAIRPPSPQ